MSSVSTATVNEAQDLVRESAAGAVLLSVRGVSKSYGTRPALKNVDLEVRAGEFVALLGPNGAGKSTLFQLLTGLFNADAGEVQVCGQNMRVAPVRALG
ncbi:MAG: ATP-binding cassette domain-containing protein, partial [Thauera sp.]|nr:ATP-binding cassette domain-containing protein [Thauera sp.]